MRVSAHDQAEFGARVEPYRRELRVHCYRMMGSLQDAEDMVQETFLRAWRRRDAVEEVTSLRPWLYKVATNICLDALKSRPKRRVPATHSAEGTLAEPVPADLIEPIWLEPFPDALLPLASDEQNPEAVIVAHEDIALAFIVALHCLPPRQRAILLLRDVLDWSASEVAALLDTTESAVKSALHRARTVLAKRRVTPDDAPAVSLDAAAHAQLTDYVRAWESADIDAFVRLLKDDATFSMPPIPAWYRGRETIRTLVLRTIFAGEARARWRLLPTRANGQLAFAIYRQTATPGLHRAYAIQVLTFSGAAITDVITFRDTALVARFGLPSTLTTITA